MKIVLNKGYGMFDLSHEAKLLLAKKKNIELFVYYRTKSQIFSKRPIETNYDDNYDDNYDAVWGEYYLLKDFGDEYYLDFDKDHDEWWDNIYKFNFSNSNFSNRTDFHLIELVEELGPQASGSISKLEIVEIPNGSSYYIITNYDGIETLYYSESEIKVK